MIKKKINQLLKKVAPKEGIVSESPEKRFGDYSTNLALVLAGKEKKNPLETAKKIVEKIPKADFLEKIEVAPPGFINFWLSEKWLQSQITEILKQKDKFGQSNIGKNKKIQIEFISANPTGPLTLGNGRGGFLGDVLGRVLEKTGFKVEREYYVNDTGNQILALGNSVLKNKEAVYKGEYIKKIAKEIKETEPKKAGEEAAKIILKDYIKKDIQKMGIKFNSFMSEKSLVTSSAVKKAIDKLRIKQLVYEKDGAVWFSSSKFGDDQDRVLVKKTGEFTYFAADIAYHLNKLVRRYDLLINIWGADHHGDVPRISAVAKVFGFDDKLKIILHQFVRLVENGKAVRMSKRAGTYITLSQLIDEVGLDAVCYFFTSVAPETHLDFDLKLAKEQSKKNPVYYIQYVSARIHGILAKIKNQKGGRQAKIKITNQNLKLLNHPAEIDLIKQLVKLPDLIEEIAHDYQIQKLPFYALDLANTFHNFYEKCHVLEPKNSDLSSARLALVSATQIALENTLDILGIKAPKRM